MQSKFSPIFTFLFQDNSTSCSNHLATLDLANFVAVGCHKLAISKLIGVSIFLASLLVKLPTFVNIFKSGSAAGFAMTSVYLDCILYSNASLYGYLMHYPPTAYGETAAQAVQAFIMVALVWFYTDSLKPHIMAPPILCYMVYLYIVFALLPPSMYILLPRLNWPVVILNRGSQIHLNYTQQSTGSTSLFTMCMQAGGSLVRIATTLIQIGVDVNLLAGYSLGVTLNGSLIAQYFMYYGQELVVGVPGVEEAEDLSIYETAAERRGRLGRGEKVGAAKTAKTKARGRSKTPVPKKAAVATQKKASSRSKTPVKRASTPTPKKASPRATRRTRKKTQ